LRLCPLATLRETQHTGTHEENVIFILKILKSWVLCQLT